MCFFAKNTWIFLYLLFVNSKYLRRICEGLKLQCIAAGIEKKHRCLFADFPLEADVRFDDKFYAGLFEALRQRYPVGHREDCAEVLHGHLLAIDLVAGSCGHAFVYQVCRNLVPKKIEIDPSLSCTANATAQQARIKLPCGGQIQHGKGQVKRYLHFFSVNLR